MNATEFLKTLPLSHEGYILPTDQVVTLERTGIIALLTDFGNKCFNEGVDQGVILGKKDFKEYSDSGTARLDAIKAIKR